MNKSNDDGCGINTTMDWESIDDWMGSGYVSFIPIDDGFTPRSNLKMETSDEDTESVGGLFDATSIFFQADNIWDNICHQKFNESNQHHKDSITKRRILMLWYQI